MKAGLKKVLAGVLGDTRTHVSDVAAAGNESTTYFIRPGYRSRPAPQYFEDFVPAADRIYQPDVYALAGAMACLGPRRIVDVGCGKGGKLAALAAHNEVVGVDIGVNIEYCRSNHRFGRWFEHDIESSDELPLDSVDLRGAIVICADVIEHLVDPLPLLHKLRRCSDRGAIVLLSTPERDLVRGQLDPGPPKNQAHVREWNLGELRALLLHVGFTIPFFGLTANDSVRREMSTMLAILTSGTGDGPNPTGR